MGFSEEDIGLKQFREVGAMVSALKNGNLDPAKEQAFLNSVFNSVVLFPVTNHFPSFCSWLSLNAANLGPKAKQLEYVLAKLDFLMDVQRCVGNPAGVIACMPKIVPYAPEFPAGNPFRLCL